MKTFFLTLILSICAFFVPTAFALDGASVTSAGFNNLTDQQKAEIIKTITDKAAENGGITNGMPNSQKVGEWVDIGMKVGAGLGGAAKEIGVTANEFVKTPVGQWTMALIIWKFMGSAIIHVVGGLIILLFGTTFIIYLQRSTCKVTKEYGEPRTLWGIPIGRAVMKYQRDVPRDHNGSVSSYVIGWIFSYGVVITVAMAAIFSY